MANVYVANDKRYEKMVYNRVGKSGLKFPAVSLGFWHNFGSKDNYDNMKAMCRTAFDVGITQFDLANNYGPVYGSAEENAGRILKEDFKPYRDELVITTYVGMCGSDLHFYEEGRLANWELNGPLALGHEPGGVVTAIGEGVEGFEIGDKVAIEPGVGCGKCKECLEGRYNLCQNVRFMAIPNEKDGVFAEYCVHDACMCFKLPENVGTMEGGLMEPLCVGLHATELSNAKMGETAIVLGSGCIGLCTIMALKARGVQEIYVSDTLEKRLNKALEVGATRVFNIAKGESIEEFAKTLPGGGVDQVYECAGNRKATLQTCKLIRRAGKVTLVGVSPEPILELDIATLNAMEGTIYSVYRYRNLYPKAISMVASGAIPLKKIVSHEFDFKDCIHAIEYSLNHKEDVIKAVVKF